MAQPIPRRVRPLTHALMTLLHTARRRWTARSPLADPRRDLTAGLRYEIKYQCAPEEHGIVLARIHSLTAAFRPAHPSRRVNNVYFDSHGWTNLEEHLAGIPERGKLRLRWYGGEQRAVKGTLEWKRKRGGLGNKVSCRLQRALDLTRRSWAQIRQAIAEENLGELDPLFRYFDATVLVNRYDRDYFESGDGRVRLTIDTGLRVYDQRLTPIPNLDRETPFPGRTVIELKAAATDHERLQEIANEFPLRSAAFSKYTQAIFASDGR